MATDLELSVVMPCLNEADTLEVCIDKAQEALEENGITGEIIVADNGSNDGSPEIAERSGARVVRMSARGYGAALMGGIAAARGRYVVMGDADDSYDFRELPKLVAKLREGCDVAQGCRLPAGGGRVLPGAMPWSHRWIGNPFFSWLVRSWFRVPVTDVYCGLRGFRREFQAGLDQRCTGMEFAPEMLIKAAMAGGSIAEVPITLHPDGRRAHAPHLRTLRDGWRTLRFFLLYSPARLFVMPGVALLAAGLLAFALALPGVQFGRVIFDAHTLLFGSLAIICGYQALLFAVFTKTFAVTEGLLAEDRFYSGFYRHFNLERGLVIGAIGLVVGAALLGAAVWKWRLADFGRLDYASTMRLVVPGATLTALGFQTVLSSFFTSILGLRRR